MILATEPCGGWVIYKGDFGQGVWLQFLKYPSESKEDWGRRKNRWGFNLNRAITSGGLDWIGSIDFNDPESKRKLIDKIQAILAGEKKGNEP